ncbi:MAG: glycosyltransferase [Chloroflexi bacterium]|nr:glycosyltransferase [Chloroflexota bacterium]
MKRILILFSDTGGGHRAAAEAIRDALMIKHPNEVSIEMVDVFRAYSPFPFKYMPEMYPWVVNRSKSGWGVGYNFTNTRSKAKLIQQTMYVSMEKSMLKMLREHPADLIVSVHSLLTRTTMQGLMQFEKRPPFMVVVTDLVSTHMFWYDKDVDRCIVPTQPAFDRGLQSGLTPEQMRITGLPVHPNFAERLMDKADARKELGWDLDLPAVLMVGGGEGMGALYETARAVNDMRQKCQLIVIAGRNHALKAKIEADRWNQPTHVYPFVTNMPVLMAASDILVSKAGPATISEACIAGLPVILYDAIPGQETGNVEFVVEHDAGIYAPSPTEAAEAVAKWLGEGPEGLKRHSDNARRLGRPNAVWDIADEVWEYAQKPLIPTNRRNIFIDFSKRVPMRSRRF